MSAKRSSPLLRILPLAVLAAVLVYFAAQIHSYFSDPMTVTVTYESQAEDTVSMEGWLVRTEEPLPAQSGTLSRVRQEGERVGVGQVLARVYANDGALQTVSQIETLELQLQQLQFALTSYLNPDAALAASRISRFISRTASRIPTKTARLTMAWPICSSRIPGRRATGCTLK